MMLLDELLARISNCFQRFVPEKKPPDPEWGTINKKTQQSNLAAHFAHSPPVKTNKDGFLQFGEMPDSENLELAFRDLLDELDLSPDKEKELDKQSDEKKWAMIMEQNSRKDRAGRQGGGCAPSVAQLLQQLDAFVSVFPERYSLPLAVQQIESLSISLRSESFSFVQKFLELSGTSLLVALLDESRRRGADALATPLLGCFRALLHSSVGRNVVLEDPGVLLAIAGALDLRNSKCKVLSLEILSALCLAADGGHRAVLHALTQASPLLGERTRFQTLVDDLHREHERSFMPLVTSATMTRSGRERDDRPGAAETNALADEEGRRSSSRETERVRIAIMSLVNALLKSGPAEQSLEFRLHLRYELLMLGIQEVIDRLRNEHGSVLEDHFDLFEMMRQEDEHELSSSLDSGASSPLDFESPSGMAEALSTKLDSTVALPHLISLLQHMLMIPGDEQHVHLWRLFDLILQQLSLQTAMGSLSGVDSAHFAQCPLKINMDELISRLRTENECDRLEKELADAHAELDAERRRVVELENRISDLQDGVSLSSFSRVSDLSSSPSDPCHSPTFFSASNNSAIAAVSVKPPSFVPPPPPPPTAEQLRNGLRHDTIPQKKVPKPPCPLKTVNWTPIPFNRINGTIWEKADDEKLYKHMNLHEIATNFASGAKNEDVESAAVETLQRMRRRRASLVTVIDARRAQNCTIMLSKLKLSHREIRNSVITMDERKKLPKDMIEQMLKFVPSKEEIVALRDAVQRHKTPTVLALADRFLYEIAQVPRYEQRLRCLYTIRTFQERLSELTPYFNTVIRASNVVSDNKKLRQFLALILAIGNYLNYGKRNGNAYGFSVDSLGALHNVRSASRSDRNLMHFVVELVEEKFPDLLKLKKELSPVFDAAKFNRNEMESELRNIEIALREMASELAAAEQKIANNPVCLSEANSLESSSEVEAMSSFAAIPEEIPSVSSANVPTTEYNSTTSLAVNDGSAPKAKSQQSTRSQPPDQFAPVVRSFLETARKAIRDTQTLHREMNEKFLMCTRLYGADIDAPNLSKKNSPDEFFGTFSRCFTQFTECQRALWTEREEIERVKRQTLVRSVFTKKAGTKNRMQGNLNRDFESLVNALQSGEIFSEDLSRLRTSIRLNENQNSPARRKANQRQKQQLQQQSGETTKIEMNATGFCRAIIA